MGNWIVELTKIGRLDLILREMSQKDDFTAFIFEKDLNEVVLWSILRSKVLYVDSAAWKWLFSWEQTFGNKNK